MYNNARAFTIVEILIVIVVISILASITAVAYRGMQNRAYVASVTSDLTKASDQIELYQTYSQARTYPIATTGVQRDVLETIPIKVSPDAYSTVANSNMTYISSVGGTDYLVLATVKNGPVLYIRGSDSGVHTYTGTPSYPSGTLSNIATSAGLTGTFDEATAAYVGTDGGWRFWK